MSVLAGEPRSTSVVIARSAAAIALARSKTARSVAAASIVGDSETHRLAHVGYRPTSDMEGGRRR
jgi:hypothetical protein